MEIDYTSLAKQFGGTQEEAGGDFAASDSLGGDIASASPTLGERFKAGFGPPEMRAEMRQKEESAGKRGFQIADIPGDIADVAGGVPTLIGTTIGAYGGLPGMVGGAGLGELARQAVGIAFGVQQGYSGKEPLTSAGSTLVFSFLGGPLFKSIFKSLPKKAMSLIFKESADDIMKYARSGKMNPTQAQEVLTEGFRGNVEKMMTYANNTMKDVWSKTQTAIAGKTVNLGGNKVSSYVALLKDYSKQFKKSTFGFQEEFSSQLATMISRLSKIKDGIVPADLALETRIFIDGIRKSGSFKLNPALSIKEKDYKMAADYARGKIAEQLPEVGKLMSRYAIHTEAFKDLAKYGAKEANAPLLDLLDLFIMYGIDPTAYVLRHAGQTPRVFTNVAQGLFKTGNLLDKAVPPGLVPGALSNYSQRAFGGQ